MKGRSPIAISVLAALAALTLLSGCAGLSNNDASTLPQPTESAQVTPTAAATPVATATDKPSATPFVISEAWFDDALFIGDSLTGALYNYNLVYGGLGNAVIAYANGYACHLASSKDNLLAYKGRGLTAEDMVAEIGAKKVFFLVAMNDIGTPIDELRDHWEALLSRVLEKNPDVRIFIQSGTPIYDETAYFSNENMREYNEMLKTLCAETGHTYVDIARGLADETGRMKAEYHMDFVHFGEEGCAVWIENLYDTSAYSPAPTE